MDSALRPSVDAIAMEQETVKDSPTPCLDFPVSILCSTFDALAPPAPANRELLPPTGAAAAADKGAGSLGARPLQVYLRIRPSTSSAATAGEQACLVATSGSIVRTDPPETDGSAAGAATANNKLHEAREFAFTRVLGSKSTQDEVYEQIAKPLVDRVVLAGGDVLLFAYGMTGSGKSHTMIGTPANAGVLPRALTEVFLAASAQLPHEAGMESDDDTVGVSAAFQSSPVANPIHQAGGGRASATSAQPPGVTLSYLEVYNEQVFDLLKNDQGSAPKRPLRLIDDGHGSVRPRGLSQHSVAGVDEALALLREGDTHRKLGRTHLNKASSRSHAVCCIEARLRNGKKASVWVADLAGAERNERTGARGVSKQQTEANNINSSLFALTSCLALLRQGGAGAGVAVPYRQSKLTHLFAAHLSGRRQAAAAMIVNVSPEVRDFVETQHILKMAALAQKVTINQRAPTGEAAARRRGAATHDANGRRIGGQAAAASDGGGGGGGGGAKGKRRAKRASEAESEGGGGGRASEADGGRASAGGAAPAPLRAQLADLKARVRSAEDKAAAVEEAVRRECAHEMAKQVASIQTEYRGRLASMQAASGGGGDGDGGGTSAAALARERDAHDDVGKSVHKKARQDKLLEYVTSLETKYDEAEEELDRLRAEHAAEVSALRTRLASAAPAGAAGHAASAAAAASASGLASVSEEGGGESEPYDLLQLALTLLVDEAAVDGDRCAALAQPLCHALASAPHAPLASAAVRLGWHGDGFHGADGEDGGADEEDDGVEGVDGDDDGPVGEVPSVAQLAAALRAALPESPRSRSRAVALSETSALLRAADERLEDSLAEEGQLRAENERLERDLEKANEGRPSREEEFQLRRLREAQRLAPSAKPGVAGEDDGDGDAAMPDADLALPPPPPPPPAEARTAPCAIGRKRAAPPAEEPQSTHKSGFGFKRVPLSPAAPAAAASSSAAAAPKQLQMGAAPRATEAADDAENVQRPAAKKTRKAKASAKSVATAAAGTPVAARTRTRRVAARA